MTVYDADNTQQLIAPSPRVTGSVMRTTSIATPAQLPTSSWGTVDSSFTDLGYTDETGLKQKEERSNTDVFSWGGALVGTLQEKYSRTMSFKLLQFINTKVLQTTYGTGNVSYATQSGQAPGAEWVVQMNPSLLDTCSWVFDGFYMNRLVRVVIPIGRVTQIGDVDLTHKAFMMSDCTLKAFPDNAGNHGYLYLNNGLAS